MSVSTGAGFTLWVRGAGKNTALAGTSARIAEELERRGVAVETIDAAALARETCRRRAGGEGLAIALAITASALNRHGIACLIHGARVAAAEFDWKRRKPERLLDVVLAHENETVTGKGPHLVLRAPRAARSFSLGSHAREDQPRGQARTGGGWPGARPGSHAPDHRPRGQAGTPSDQPRWDPSPLFRALANAGWIPAESSPSNGDDTLIRERLRDLGYL